MHIWIIYWFSLIEDEFCPHIHLNNPLADILCASFCTVKISYPAPHTHTHRDLKRTSRLRNVDGVINLLNQMFQTKVNNSISHKKSTSLQVDFGSLTTCKNENMKSLFIYLHCMNIWEQQNIREKPINTILRNPTPHKGIPGIW